MISISRTSPYKKNNTTFLVLQRKKVYRIEMEYGTEVHLVSILKIVDGSILTNNEIVFTCCVPCFFKKFVVSRNNLFSKHINQFKFMQKIQFTVTFHL